MRVGLTVSSPFDVDGAPKVDPRIAPALGEHTATVLREAGYAEDQIRDLYALGVVTGPVRTPQKS